jgi:pimeloyl-ACP methyl ester carboxylesterase
MTYATNPSDGARVYFEDAGGAGAPILMYAGFADPLDYARDSGLARALAGEYRLVFADHRGHGRSDKPHDKASYALRTRVADVVAVLDELGIQRAHFIGFSWGARLGFALGEYAPERLRSLVLCGNQPYAWDPGWPISRVVAKAIEAARQGGMHAMLASWEASIGEPFPDPVRAGVLDNDPAALIAAWESVWEEGDVSRDLGVWRVPCLIYTAEDDDLRPNAERAASEIPGALFLAVPGHDHYSAPEEVGLVLPHVREWLRRSLG